MDILKKKEKKFDPESDNRDEVGDAWIYDAVKRDTYFFVNFVVGRLSKDTCTQFVTELKSCFCRPLGDCTIEFYSDTAKGMYTKLLPQFFPRRRIRYGQLMKLYSGTRLSGKLKKSVFGNVPLDQIDTTNIENMHGIIRERIGRLVRKTKTFSKSKARLRNSLELFRFYWNFMKPIKDGLTPASRERLLFRTIKWGEFFRFV